MTELFAHAHRVYQWLRHSSTDTPVDKYLRIIKVSEEAGEVASALIGYAGQNPRKGYTHTEDDIADELCDVAISALVALYDWTVNPEEHLSAYIDARGSRLPQ